MLYIIGLGLNEFGISLEGKEALNECKKIYLEGYTVDFPYEINKLESSLGKSLIRLDRNHVESDKLAEEAKKEDIGLLVYGSPLFATTHISLIQEAKKKKVKIKIIYSSSVLDAIAATGLQLYKFGKIASMPAWTSNYKPDSFIEIIRQNQSIKAHSLILCDIGLDFIEALNQLEEILKNKKIKTEKIIVCSRLGCEDSKFYYDSIANLKKKKVQMPFCIIMPSELHFVEKEHLENI